MRTIHKYLLDGPSVVLEMPVLAFFLHGSILPNGNANIWFEVEDDSDLVERRFIALGTGKEVPKNAVHMFSVIEYDEPVDFVWHIYEVPV